ncbi:hypothetical protein G5714_023878 [Onychostoma macrolepis]|uniref:Uncharacterized protein n=1 Tax=Onychostoma macrolepis TaxID=369639 RepID=A0A7J6BI36_9TELE|nr:hypothetical protein G5714_023878 [Onychostoma macrolepis]
MTIVLAARNRQGGVVNTHSGASRLSQWLVFGAECSFPPPRDFDPGAGGLPSRSGRGFWPFEPWWRFGRGCLGLTAGSCSCRTAVGGANGLPARCAEEERERAGGFAPARFVGAVRPHKRRLCVGATQVEDARFVAIRGFDWLYAGEAIARGHLLSVRSSPEHSRGREGVSAAECRSR